MKLQVTELILNKLKNSVITDENIVLHYFVENWFELQKNSLFIIPGDRNE